MQSYPPYQMFTELTAYRDLVGGALLALSIASLGCGSIASGDAVDSGSLDGEVRDAHSASDGARRDAGSDAGGGRDARGDHERSAESGTADARIDDSSAGDAIACPTQMPAQSSPCGVAGQACSFGPSQCDCTFTLQGSIWDCFACPTTQPTSGGACMGMAGGQAQPYTCSYGLENCRCFEEVWSCESCPSSRPIDGTPCADFKGDCFYASPTPSNCSCSDSADAGWSCVEPCPAEAPQPGSSCSFAQGIACSYGTKSCTCDQEIAFCN